MAIADELGPNDWEYGYDTLDRLTEADNTSIDGPNAGQSLSWAYDLTGNRTGETENAIQTPYQTDPASNRLNQVGAQARLYDAVGNTLDDGQGTQSRYSARNRLIQTIKAALTTRYQHNAFGERVAKTQAGLTTEYVYDDAGHLIGEYPSGPSAVSGATEVLWLGDTPIAVLKRRAGSTDGGPSGGCGPTAWQGTPAGGVEVFYLHPDHLDTPRVLVNASNQPVWRWDSAPFGDTDATEQPTAGIPSFRFSLRFPGQQYDQETGTHYNYFRDYEPGVGRYVQSDPVGLEDGPNTYVYSASSPLRFFDVFGLAKGALGPRPPTPKEPLLERSRGKCEGCGVEFGSGGPETMMEGHHEGMTNSQMRNILEPLVCSENRSFLRRIYKRLYQNIENMLALCKRCHDVKHPWRVGKK